MIGRIWNITAVLMVSLGLYACADIHRMAPDTKFNDAQESVLVLGLAPSKHRVGVYQGVINGDGVWHGTALPPPTFMGAAKEGYVLAKASSGSTYALNFVTVLQAEGQVLGGRLYMMCGKNKTLVFSVPPGKVVYLTDLNFVEGNDELRFTYTNDFQRAQAYVDQNFPALKGRLEMGVFDFKPTDLACPARGSYTTVIFAPGRR